MVVLRVLVLVSLSFLRLAFLLAIAPCFAPLHASSPSCLATCVLLASCLFLDILSLLCLPCVSLVSRFASACTSLIPPECAVSPERCMYLPADPAFSIPPSPVHSTSSTPTIKLPWWGPRSSAVRRAAAYLICRGQHPCWLNVRGSPRPPWFRLPGSPAWLGSKPGDVAGWASARGWAYRGSKPECRWASLFSASSSRIFALVGTCRHTSYARLST